jgi:uncharacterized phage protein gp47/JayE
MAFNRKSMERMVQDMVDWTKGVSTKLTDFRVGSRSRTLLEAVAKEIEEYYDRVYRAIKTTIEENIYTVLGFSKRPALYSTGSIRFGRLTPADANYMIPLGTIVKTKATATKAPVNFRTTQDVLIPIGATSVDCPVICQVPGTDGNAEAATVVDFVTKPAGIENVTNVFAFNNGREEETKDEQKNRFQKFIASLSRGTLPSIEYGATTAQLLNTEGLAVERVVDAKAFEDLALRKGEVDCYIWNGVGAASTALLAEATKIVFGYYDTDGKPIYGYKPAGIQVNMYTASTKPVTIRLIITPIDGVTLSDLKVYIEREVADFFGSLKQGGKLVQTALETRIKLIDGVDDVKLALSTDDGVTFSDGNLTSAATEILIPKSPYIYQ